MVALYDFQVTLASRKPVWELGGWAGETSSSGEFTTAKDMLEAAGLADLDVRKAPLYAGRKGPLVPNKYANVTKDGRVVGVVGPSYRIIQMEEAFSFADNLIDSGDGNWERAGSLQNGSIAFGCLEFTHLGITVPGDEADGDMKPYLLIVNSFDGSYPYMGKVAWIHPRCTNTFQMAAGGLGNRFKIRHSGSLDGKIQMAREAIGFAFAHAEESKVLIERLALKQVVDAQVEAIFKAVWPVSEELPEARRDETTASKAFASYLSSPTVEPIRGTAWGAFNAVTEYLDHVAEYKAGKKNTAEDVKATSILLGTSEWAKERALNLLLA